MVLDGDEFGKALVLGQGVGLGQLIGKAVGDAYIPRLAGLNHAVEAVHDVIERHAVVPHVVDVQIDVVHAEVAQTGVYHGLNVLLGGDAALYLLVGEREELGGHDYLVAAREVAQRAAQVLLAGAALVAYCGVKEVYPQVEAVLYYLAGHVLVHRPGVLAVGSVAEAHAAHADARDGQVGIAQFRVFHCRISSLCRPQTASASGPCLMP